MSEENVPEEDLDSDPLVTLDQGPVPRERVGPFLLLGLDKGADAERIEAHWAQRVIWARKGEPVPPLPDVNWAREVLRDPEQRVRADLDSINADTAAGVVGSLEKQFLQGEGGPPPWSPHGGGEALGELVAPEPEEIRARIVLPRIPEEAPVIAGLLQWLLEEPPDPWNLPKEVIG